ncbi:CHAT domain protein [Symmachiella dynata]|uniref:CHAT domain-containing protein n=1 Tax=Symmachiella dynata TaxID=2527995 RepID=UPI001188062D|nr:CHAT domain-containing protein [Symmachiella dynata]QDT50541.1 CHAT domain protein [Symmachiella dynata]
MSQVILEIGLNKWGDDSFAINLRLIESLAAADPVVQIVDQPISRLKRETYLDVQFSAEEYGKRLSEAIFSDDKALQMLGRARQAARNTNDKQLRVRLVLSPHMPFLHDLRWETLCDPSDAIPLFMRDDCLFSRYLPSTDFRYVSPRVDDRIRALVVVANPRNLDKYAARNFAPVNVEAEFERINKALKGVSITQLHFGSTGPASVDRMVDTLQYDEDGFDILCLVCHGAFLKSDVSDAAEDQERRPRLWLEDDEGDADVVSAAALAVRLNEVANLPKLAVLVSCESAGSGDDGLYGGQGALAACGPRLVQAGIPAVVAMQGSVSMETMSDFLPAFFKSLRDSGQIDLAMSRGRAAIREKHDSWMPVLLMRLNAGRLWHGGSTAPNDQFHAWEGVIGQIMNGQCTPILGSGLTDHVLGTAQEVAMRWADQFRYPMNYHNRDNLPQIAQYLAVTQGHLFPRNMLTDYIRRELLRHYEKRAGLDPSWDLSELIEHTGAWLREQDPFEPHSVLASFGCPLYVTTNPDSLLEDSLREVAGIEPEVATLDWRTGQSQFGPNSNYFPSKQRPLVYHLFGRVSEVTSLVLSQDDYFAYLLGSMRHKESIPAYVRKRLADSGLMFIGFQLNDWSFRVLLQFIRQLHGSGLLGDYKHVAVQIDPTEGQLQDPEMARRYLRESGNFGEARVEIFWGSVKEFLKELQSRMPPQDRFRKPAGVLK